jgi:SAM-dependent methyltransferase
MTMSPSIVSNGFCCPQCKSSLTKEADGYICQNCKRSYSLHDGYIDFIGDSDFYAGEVSRKEMRSLIVDIDSMGYENAIARFLERYTFLYDYITDIRRVDWIYHCLGKSNLRCLDIGSGLGNVSEILSYFYQEIYSLEAVRERIEFQKRRYKSSKRTNITLVRGNAIKLPFEDNYFDLIVCNGVLEWIGSMNINLDPRDAQLSFLYEVKRVLSDNGCLYVGIENRFGLQFLLGAKDHSGLPFTSIMPRSIANIFVRNFGELGGIYGDRTLKKKEKRGYYTYTYSIWGYNSLFSEAGFRFRPYWAIPSYNDPYFSGKLDDEKGVKGFISYLRNDSAKFKTILSILEKLDESFLRAIMTLFSPSFLFYCYKSECKESTFDDMISRTAVSRSYTTLSTGTGVTYLLYDKKGKPIKVIHLKRRWYIPSSITIPFFDNNIHSNYRRPPGQIWIEDWIVGKKLNPLKFDESQMAIDWLTNFQNETRSISMEKDYIHSEVDAIKNTLLQSQNLNSSGYQRWLDDYESYIRSFNISRTAEHGDFWYGNILIDKSSHKINVIDWEYFVEQGNPLFDFIFFIINAMLLPGYSTREFHANINGYGRFSPILKELTYRFKNHFGFELDLDILLPYVILRFLARKLSEGLRKYDKTIKTFTEMLSILSSEKR